MKDTVMHKSKFSLARKCVNPGLTNVNLITFADVVRAFCIVINSEPGLNRTQITNLKSSIRSASFVICRYLDEQRTPQEKKTPEDTPVGEIIGFEDGLKKWLKGNSTVFMCRKRLIQSHLILACARSMGLTHGEFEVQDEWERLNFGEMDQVAKRLMNALIGAGVRPQDVCLRHVEAWAKACFEDECEPEPVRQSISQFKLSIRRANLQASFPKLNVELVQPTEYKRAFKNMDPHVQEQLDEILQLLKKLDEDEIIRKGERARDGFLREVERLYGYAELSGLIEKVTDLDQILNQDVITGCARWGYSEKKWKQEPLGKFLNNLHAVLEVYPSYKSRNWDWMLELIWEFPEEPESQKEARRAERAFHYDYDALATIPGRISEKRRATPGLSREEKEWRIHCEFLMLFLMTAPWPPHCLINCRVFEDNANLVKVNDRWFFRFSPLENPFRRAVSESFPRRLVPLLELYIEYRGERPGPLFHMREGGNLSSKSFRLLVVNLTEVYVGAKIPPSAFRDIFAYWWLNKYPGLSGYTTLASIFWENVHAVRMRYDKAYCAAFMAKHPRRNTRRRKRNLVRRDMTPLAS
jgi:hypothetical protein